MSLRSRSLESAGLEPAAELVEHILSIEDSQNVALILPGLWCFDEVVDQLGQSAPTLTIDTTHGRVSGICALEAALDAADNSSGNAESESLSERLEEWSREALLRSGRVPWVIAEFAHLMHDETATLLREFAGLGWLRVLLPMRYAEETSPLFDALRETGSLTDISPTRLREASMGRALQVWFGPRVSLNSQRRIFALSGGHVGLAKRVAEVAVQEGVIQRRNDVWVWEPDETPLHDALEEESVQLVSGLEEAERTVLQLTAVAGRIPEQWATEEFSDEVVLSLRRQGILGPDYKARLGSVDLRVEPEVLREAVRRAVRDVGAMSLWFAYGKRIPRITGSSLSEAALVCWAARSGEPMSTHHTEWAARVCLEHGWYEQIGVLYQSLSRKTAAMRVLFARAECARGNILKASEELHNVLDQAESPYDEVLTDKTQREAVTLAQRMSLFHPETAEPILTRLHLLGVGESAMSLDHVVQTTQVDEPEAWVSALLDARLRGTWDEAVAAQLWVGVKLGLRRHPELGRLVLSSLLDDLVREGGQPDVEEAVVASLLMIMLAQGWRTDMVRVHFQAWNGRTVRDSALPGVTNVVASVVAMQQDKMHSAYMHATAAIRAFDISDPFGLAPFSASLAMAAASYMDGETAAQARRDFESRVGTGAVERGFPHLRLTAQGMALIGVGRPTADVAESLLALADQAREESEWLQEQQLLLLSALGMSAGAAGRILEAPWRDQPGRPSMIHMLAEALATSDDQLAVETAEVFIAARSQHFGLTILAALWFRRDSLEDEVRAHVAKTVLALREQLEEPSWLLSTFSDLSLSSRDRVVLEALHRGDSTRIIARTLSVSPRTVESTVSSLLKRFGCANRVELIALDLLAS